jgi:hypothetical protein
MDVTESKFSSAVGPVRTAEELAVLITEGGHFTVTPAPYLGAENEQIVSSICAMRPKAVTLADFERSDLLAIFNGFKLAGVNVAIAWSSKTTI